jgi:hypothetical protein
LIFSIIPPIGHQDFIPESQEISNPGMGFCLLPAVSHCLTFN